jgi:hypothetical protein
MAVDRFVKTILTIIALELFWIGIKDTATPVAAQNQLTPVIIRGVQLPAGSNDYLPVGVVGQPVRVGVTGTVAISSDRPLKVENIGYAPSKNPGE